MSQHDDDVARLHTDDGPRQTEDNRSQDDAPADAESRVDDEPESRVDDSPTEQLPTRDADAPAELFARQEVERFRIEWQEIQTRFVDDPRDAVQGADHLVATVMQSLATTFTNHKHELEGQWQQGSDVETEDLRRALQRYRSFFNQLLNV